MRSMLVTAVWLSAAVPLIGQQLGSKFEDAVAMKGTLAGTAVSQPQAPGSKAPGKIRIGIALAQAQMGQGNSAQSDYGTPVRNAIVLMMSGPLLEVAALDASLPLQVQAEAQQKECDYIVFSAVTVKHSGGGLGKFMKAGTTAGAFTSIGIVTHTIPRTDGAMAAEEATYAIEHATSELSGFNGQVKSKDEVTFTYQLVPIGQSKPKLENSLKGKSKSDGEDVLSQLIRQAANGILTDVTKK